MLNIEEIVNFYVEKASDIAKLLESEPQLVEVHGDKIVIVGDLHGDYTTLEKILQKYSPPEWKLVFLGDYVDRGEYQIETLTRVLKLKLDYPEHVVLLRGNHESPLMNLEYGFVFELQEKLGQGRDYLIYNVILRNVFVNLPYAALINSEILALHGGLAKGIDKPEDIKSLPKGDDGPRDRVAFQIVWNDPADDIYGFVPNYLRGCDEGGLCVYFWGPDVTESFLTRNGLKLILRAHEYTEQGYKWNHREKVLTIFSSCAGPYRFVKPKIAKVEKGELKIEEL